MHLESNVYEKEPTNYNIGIQVNRLTKVFPGKKVAVRQVSFNMFENQITVLLGHNGAGKTTTMSMLTGMITPTEGTAIVNGYDIRTNMPQVRDSLGLCPQHNILFDELTVAEHIRFFSKLKGLNKKEIDEEINTYIDLLQLVPKRNARSKTLSGGMKRKLSVAIAMCGRSKIVMLDEPTAGMDPAARRALWDMIVKQKKDRTILLSTHFMDEADLLGDRIAIMAGGQLQCCGSSFFLKKKYGAGYHLIMDKRQDCVVSQVTDLLKVYIPNIKVATNIGSELTYILAEDQAVVFEKMLADLESKSKTLGVNSYGISLTTMQEVFMKVGADHGQEEINNGEIVTNGNMVNEDEITNYHKADSASTGSAHPSDNSRINITTAGFVTGFTLWRNQFVAMLMKKFRVTQRNWILLLIQNVIPIAFIVITMIVSRMMNIGIELPRIDSTLDPFIDPITTITRDNEDNTYYVQYRNILERENREIRHFPTDSMTNNMLNQFLSTILCGVILEHYANNFSLVLLRRCRSCIELYERPLINQNLS
ncbi:ABC transporter [Popillia japonica]|uniref:ABC transporter n=1 Tax=Popillia japonica TaxID=7064 RepID=A0AAW1I761_POPJA